MLEFREVIDFFVYDEPEICRSVVGGYLRRSEVLFLGE